MRSRISVALSLLMLVFFSSAAGAQVTFRSVTVLVGETWTGNAYVQPLYNVTGSEAAPIDFSVGAGARIDLVRFSPGLALTLDPRLTLGARRYLLYPDGWVVPTQIETALGATEDPNEAGIGSARVLTVGLSVPVGLEMGLGERAALTMAVSPTTLYRIRAGRVAVQTDPSELDPMYAFFYGNLRWLRPELHLAVRVAVSDYLAFTIRALSSVSVLDLADPTLPWWDQLQAGGTVEFNLSPPFSGLLRGLSRPKAEEIPQPGI